MLYIVLIILIILIILLILLITKKNKEKFIGGGIVSSLCNNKGYIYKNEEDQPILTRNNLNKNTISVNKNICYCIDGWYGDNCEYSDCSGNGTLTSYKDSSGNEFKKCVCKNDFKGDHCQYSDAITCNGQGTVSDTGVCSCNQNIFGRFCNSICKNGKVINDKCVCKKEKMYFKDDIDTNQAYKFQDLYKGDKCDEVINLKDIKDIENLYRDELPSDEINENKYIFKICPFSKDIEIKNLKVTIDGLLPYSIESITDNNGCYVIDPSKYNNYIPECISGYEGIGSGMQFIGNMTRGEPLSSGNEGKTSSPLCSPLKFSVFIGYSAEISFDVINNKVGSKESGNIKIVQNGLFDTPQGQVYKFDPDIQVTGISNYYIRKGIEDRFLSEGSMWQIPIGLFNDFHLEHDPNARSYNIIIGDCIKNCKDKECGNDGCGGICGICENNIDCNNGKCCTPNCTGKVCGDDGCGGSCGSCPSGINCINNGTKCCSAICKGDCGPDGCGGICGICQNGKTCKDGVCT